MMSSGLAPAACTGTTSSRPCASQKKPETVARVRESGREAKAMTVSLSIAIQDVKVVFHRRQRGVNIFSYFLIKCCQGVTEQVTPWAAFPGKNHEETACDRIV